MPSWTNLPLWLHCDLKPSQAQPLAPTHFFSFHLTTPLSIPLRHSIFWFALEIWLWFWVFSRAIKAGLMGGGVERSTHLKLAQNMILSVSPLNKPFLVKLDLTDFFIGLKFPSTFGDHFTYPSLPWNNFIPQSWRNASCCQFDAISLELGLGQTKQG